jgi:hypothetical protein
MNKSFFKEKKKYLYIFLVMGMLIIFLTVIVVYNRDRTGFVIGGNRIEFSTRKETNNFSVDINKTIIRTNAYKGIVKIAISPHIPDGVDLPQGFQYPVLTYEIVFTNSKKEVFTIQCPYLNMDYIILFQVGTEQAYRIIWLPRFTDF